MYRVTKVIGKGKWKKRIWTDRTCRNCKFCMAFITGKEPGEIKTFFCHRYPVVTKNEEQWCGEWEMKPDCDGCSLSDSCPGIGCVEVDNEPNT